MEAVLIGALGVVTVAIIIAGLSIHKKLQEMKELQLQTQGDKLMGMLNDNITGMQSRLDKTTETLNKRLDNAAKVIGAVQHELGGVKEIGRSIQDFQAFLTSPKLRGNLGEQILYDAMDQVFSREQYKMQYKFKDGQVVDALIRTAAGLVPIDSKFPMENYQQMLKAEDEKAKTAAHREFINAVRKHIRDIAKKYILPQEGTVNYAVMYVPAESVYYEIVLQHEELLQYSRDQKVLLVSPNTFFQFLHVIMMGMERAKLQDQAHKIWELLKGVQQETTKFGERIGVLNRHVTNAKNAMDTVTSEYTKLSGQVDQIKLLK